MPAKRTGTGFVNLQTYLGLNKDGANRIGHGLVTDVEDKGASAAENIRVGESNANSAITAGTLQGPQAGKTYTLDEAKKLSDVGGAYKGPLTMGDAGADIAALTAQAAEAQNMANAANTQSGRATLLQQKYGQNTWGGSQLDAALAGNAVGGRLEAAKGSYGKLLEKLGTAQNNVAAYAQQQKGVSQQNAAKFGGMVPGLEAEAEAARRRGVEFGRDSRTDTQQANQRAHIERNRRTNRNDDEERGYYP